MTMTIKLRPLIILFGDSITQEGFGVNDSIGWASLLSSAYSRRADVLNRGYSGYNTRHALDIVDSVFAPSSSSVGNKPLFCTVFFGANDAVLAGERQYVPIDEYSQNIKDIVRKIREKLNTSGDEASCSPLNSTPIILMTPPPVDAAAWAAHAWEMWKEKRGGRSNESARDYGRVLKSIGEELNVSVLDTWSLLLGDDGKDVYGKFLSDGLHLSTEGNKRVYDGLMNLIKTQFPHLAPMEEGEGRYGSVGIPLEEKLWTELC